MNRNETELILASVSGDTQSFNRLVVAHRERALILATRLLRNRQEAEDVVQDSFLKAWEELPRFRSECAFSSWVFRIVYNLSLNHMRRRKMWAVFRNTDEWGEDEDLFQNVPSDNPIPDEIVMLKERKAQLKAALEKLSPKQRSVFIMRHEEELSNQEIASLTGKTVGSVKANFSFAVARLKTMIEE